MNTKNKSQIEVKRIRLGHETYTFCPGNVYVLLPQAFRFVNTWYFKGIGTLPLSPRQTLHNEATRSDADSIASGGFILGGRLIALAGAG